MVKSNLKIIACILILGCAYLWNTDSPLLWGDEAGTAIFGKNILKTGVSFGFDGRNLLVFDNCASVSTSLLSKKIPWGQDYIAALSIFLFGRSTTAVRILFALIGIAAFFPLHAVLKKRSGFPGLITMLVLLSPQTLLFQRNARYYSMVLLFFAILLWLYDRGFKSEKQRFFLLSVCAALFFHTHQLAAFCTMGSFVLFCMIRDRKSFKIYFTAAIAGGLCWLVFYLSLEGIHGKGVMIINLLFKAPSQWFSLFISGLTAGILDLDHVGTLPLIAWGIALIIFSLIPEDRRDSGTVFNDPLNQIIGINLLFQIMVNAAVLGFESNYRYALLRYMPHLTATGIIPLFLFIERLINDAQIGKRLKSGIIPIAFFLLIISNSFSFSYWFEPLPERPFRFSWLPAVYGEIIRKETDGMEKLIDILLKEKSDPEDVIYVEPVYLNEVLIFYVGDNYLIFPDVIKGSECEKAIIKTVGEKSFSRFLKKPKWMIMFFDSLKEVPPEYEELKLPFFRYLPDGSRPELTRHCFVDKSEKNMGYISLYRRRDL